MKQKLLLFILLAFSFNTALPAKKSSSFIGKVFDTISFPVSPAEVSHTFDITRSADEPYTLDIDRIAELQKMYEHNFAIRDRLAKATYIATAGSLVWLGYKWGLFDSLLPGKVTSTASTAIAVPKVKDQDISKIWHYLDAFSGYLELKSASDTAHFEALDAKKEVQNGHWFINGIKNIGWSGVTIAGTLIMNSKWYSFYGYVLAEPSFKWFLSNHSIISTIDRLKRSVQALSSPEYAGRIFSRISHQSINPCNRINYS